MNKAVRISLITLAAIAALAAVLALSGYLLLRSAGLFRDPVYDTQRPALAELARPAVLVFSKTNGFIHADAIPEAKTLFERFAKQHGWSIVLSDNGAIHNAEDLRRFDLVVWNNVTGDVLTADQRQAFRNWLEGGGSWLGLHGTGGDFFPWTWFVEEVIGAEFVGHTVSPQYTTARLRFEQPEHPTLAGLPPAMDWTDELYSFKVSPRPDVSVLGNLDEASYLNDQLLEMSLRMGDDHPIIWWRKVGDGIAFYSALGHTAQAYHVPEYQRLLDNAARWLIARSPAAGAVAAEQPATP